MARSLRKFMRNVRHGLATAILDVVAFIAYLVESVQTALYNFTLPATKRWFSRFPNPPKISINDIRANRIRLNIEPNLSSPFNVEEYEVEWTDKEADTWKSVGKSDLTQRTVARLKPGTPYKFRVRAHSLRGISGWTEVLTASTKLDPVEGGSTGPGYVWTQSASEVGITFEVPTGTTKKDVRLSLKPDYIRVELTLSPNTLEGGAPQAPRCLLEGQLYEKVRSFENGSFWELSKESGKLFLILTLEKQSKSLAPKFDYWRSVVTGHPEIDTHKIEGGGGGMQMVQPGMMDTAQLRNAFG